MHNGYGTHKNVIRKGKEDFKKNLKNLVFRVTQPNLNENYIDTNLIFSNIKLLNGSEDEILFQASTVSTIYIIFCRRD